MAADYCNIKPGVSTPPRSKLPSAIIISAVQVVQLLWEMDQKSAGKTQGHLKAPCPNLPRAGRVRCRGATIPARSARSLTAARTCVRRQQKCSPDSSADGIVPLEYDCCVITFQADAPLSVRGADEGRPLPLKCFLSPPVKRAHNPGNTKKGENFCLLAACGRRSADASDAEITYSEALVLKGEAEPPASCQGDARLRPGSVPETQEAGESWSGVND